MAANYGSTPAAVPAGDAAQSLARQRSRAAARRRLRSIGAHALLIAVSIPFMLPFFWLVTGTFKPPGDLLVVPPVWIPAHWSLQNIQSLAGYSDVDLAY